MPGCSWLLCLPPHLPLLLQLPPEGNNPHSHQTSLDQGSGQADAMVPTPRLPSREEGGVGHTGRGGGGDGTVVRWKELG